jgi:hypothetical protein
MIKYVYQIFNLLPPIAAVKTPVAIISARAVINIPGIAGFNSNIKQGIKARAPAMISVPLPN